MDLNASPQLEDDDEIFRQQLEDQPEESIVEHGDERAEYVTSAVEVSRREREERMQRLKRQHADDRPAYPSQQRMREEIFHTRRQKPSSIPPPGWLDCPPFGHEIGCIIPSKVPLAETFNECVPPGKRYSLEQVLRQQRILGRKLGMVIDLTNTTRYYSVSDWRKKGIKHVKIQCRGRDSVPDNEAVNLFVHEVSQFCRNHAKKHILVHCTHGHNRTGFMIIHYLIRTVQLSVTQAIQLFSDKRPPGIYKPDYIDALYAFYHEKKPEMVVCPSTPEWKRSSELDLNCDAMPDDDDDGGPAVPLPDNPERQVVMSNDDLLGDAIPHDQQIYLRQFCYQALKMTPGGRGPLFPGSHPVSLDSHLESLPRLLVYLSPNRASVSLSFGGHGFKPWKQTPVEMQAVLRLLYVERLSTDLKKIFLSMIFAQAMFLQNQRDDCGKAQPVLAKRTVGTVRDNLQLLRQRYYYATWKADGTRYMMLITMDGCYIIDRHFNFRRVQMRFPCRHTSEGLAEKTHHFTLLDGEMVIDTLPDTQKQERRYLIYDMMALNHVSVIERPFYERWKMIDKEVIEPRNYARQHIHQSRNPFYRYELEPFRVRRKDFWLLSTVTKLLKGFIPKLSHEADGLIFQVPKSDKSLVVNTEFLLVLLFVLDCLPSIIFNSSILFLPKLLGMSSITPSSLLLHGNALLHPLIWLSFVLTFRSIGLSLLVGVIFPPTAAFSVSTRIFRAPALAKTWGLITATGNCGWDDPYVPRTHEGLLKWKYPEMNSVDFLFEVADGKERLSLHKRGVKTPMEQTRVVFPDGSDPSDYSGKIIECSWDANNKAWVWMRTRVDKGTPNDYRTYEKVMRSITDNITEEVLLNEISEIIRLPMYADRIQNDSKAHQHSSSGRRRVIGGSQ
ncbi:hypothetical protein RND71_039479 [Anisodus tanguticus]|uniref:mRNA guanylyltransferase n=1 Tax=Anisodus tanguticus TaxID=243964 RepID=A0AAE1QWP7_9SOLA|nr:hypothetical protein RND71_039479 [Anisodus tanguticus]